MSKPLGTFEKQKIATIYKADISAMASGRPNPNMIKPLINDLIGLGFDADTVTRELAIHSEAHLRKMDVEKRYKSIDFGLDSRIASEGEFFRPLVYGRDPTAFKLQKATIPASHHLIQAIYDRKLKDVSEMFVSGAHAKITRDGHHVFLIQHDWAAVLDDSVFDLNDVEAPLTPDNSGWLIYNASVETKVDFYLPYPTCFFDFKVNGADICMLVIQKDNDMPRAAMFIERRGDWYGCSAKRFENDYSNSLFHKLWKQVVAACIALEARISTATKNAASSKVNAKRIKNKKQPIPDYHVIDLTKRVEHEKREGTYVYQGKVRLHWRRGHWRTYKHLPEPVWIEWRLVGNPDLGFIDKHYRL